MDAWKYIDAFREMMGEYLKDLDLSKDETIEQLISDNEIKVTRENGTVSAAFTRNADDILSDMTNRSIKSGAVISGMMTFDKATGELLSFRYDLSECLFAVLTAFGEERTTSDIRDQLFVIEGEAFREMPKISFRDHEYTEYTEKDKYGFINQLLKKGIPLFKGRG